MFQVGRHALLSRVYSSSFCQFSFSEVLCVGTLARLLSSITNPYVHGAPSVAGSLWIFAHFISSVILSSESKASTLLVTLVYLNRVKSCLDPESFGVTRVRERIFLGAIVLATKVRIHNACTYPPDGSPIVYRRLSPRKLGVGSRSSYVYCTRHQ